MAILKKNELKLMDEKSLQAKKDTLLKELIKVNAQIATNTPPENPGRVREIKKTIARINLLMTLKKLDGGSQVKE